MKEYSRLIKEYSKEAYSLLKREPAGLLKHPFIVPGKGYSSELWDWDSWLTDVAIRQIMLDKYVKTVGFFLMRKYKTTGTAIHERFSRKAYFAGVVYKRPIFWLIFARARKIPVTRPGFI